MHIEILHVRDPDSKCTFTVFVDGERRDHFMVEDVDPGAGYELADWQEMTAAIIRDTSLSAAFVNATVAAREQAEQSEYLTGKRAP